MPIKPTPQIYQCRECGWKTRYAPVSDALIEAPPEQCEQCGGILIEAVLNTGIGSILNTALSILTRKK